MTTVLSGPQKAAVVLAQLDTDRANKVLKAMSEREVVELMAAMASLPALMAEEVRGVLAEFQLQANALLQVGQGGIDVARALLAERLGNSQAEEILERLVRGAHALPLDFLKQIEPQQIVGFIAEEHPQLMAVVLAHLPADMAAQVIAYLDESRRSDVARRIATMGRIAPDVLKAVAEILERNLSGVYRGSSTGAEISGLTAIVSILNQTDRSSEKQILGELETTDPELAEQIRNQMFVFDDVVSLDDRTLQRVLRNVVPKDLALALKNMNEAVRDKFQRNMSERAAQDLVDEIELLGPTRLSQVEAAQSAVVRVVRELEAAGEIVLARGADEYV